METRRIIGVVTVKNGLAVQSFGYEKYYPLGRPEILIKNLDSWGADEILLNLIDRSPKNNGPDFDLINKIASLKITTPIIYGGGISSEKEAVEVIKAGADRILVESILKKNITELVKTSNKLGSQALILSLPFKLINGKPYQFDYISKKTIPFNSNIIHLFKEKIVSELLLSDVFNEGQVSSFNLKILKHFKKLKIPVILFGGIASKGLIKKSLLSQFVRAIGIGNSLNYQEDTINTLKKSLKKKYFR